MRNPRTPRRTGCVGTPGRGLPLKAARGLCRCPSPIADLGEEGIHGVGQGGAVGYDETRPQSVIFTANLRFDHAVWVSMTP